MARSPFAAEVPRRELELGDEVWCLVTRDHGQGDKGRRIVCGAGRGRVTALPDFGEGDRYTVVLIVADGPCQGLIGAPVAFRRCDLYLKSSPLEHKMFGDDVRAFWGKQ